jgi:hypothetical protein
MSCNDDPQTDREYEVVQSLSDTQWRLQRIPALEMAIVGRWRGLPRVVLRKFSIRAWIVFPRVGR